MMVRTSENSLYTYIHGEGQNCLTIKCTDNIFKTTHIS